MKTARIFLALVIPTLFLLSLWFIPDTTNAQYPPPLSTPSPYPQILGATPFPDGLRINYSNCHSTSIEWNFRQGQFEVDHFDVVFSAPGQHDRVFPASLVFSNQDVEYWLANYDSISVAEKLWSVQGIGYVPGFPGQQHYFTNIVIVDCTDLLIKHRIRIPGVMNKAR